MRNIKDYNIIGKNNTEMGKTNFFGYEHVLFCSFATKCKVIRERDTKSHARHIPFSVPTHTQRLTKDSHNTRNFMPCSFRIVCGFFNVPQWSYMNMEGICEMGPTVYRPYPRRLESLTICWFNYKGSTFYSVILRPWVLVWLESNSQPPAWQPDVPPLSHQYAVKTSPV